MNLETWSVRKEEAVKLTKCFVLVANQNVKNYDSKQIHESFQFFSFEIFY